MSTALPYGTTVLAQLFRPMRGAAGVGVASFLADGAVSADTATAALMAEREQLVAVLPAFMHPGAPVCLVLTVILPDGDTEALSLIAEMPRAMPREELAQELFKNVPRIVAALFGAMRATLDGREKAA